MITCPECHCQTAEGAFCERCGAALSHSGADARIASVESRIEREVEKVDLYANMRGEPTLAYDRTCSLFEGMSGIVRFKFNPLGGGEAVENVVIEFANDTMASPITHTIRHAARTVEFGVQFPSQEIGLQSWNVHLTYHSSRRKHALAGQFQIGVRAVASRGKAAGNYNIHFNTSVGSVGPASDVNVHSTGAEKLAHLLEKDDPFEEMQRIAKSDSREWMDIPFSDDNAVVDLPTMPPGARTDHIALDFGGRRIHFFSGRTIRFGRTKEMNDIALRPPVESNDETLLPYRMVSRGHCRFELAGTKVTITDGMLDASGVSHPSSGGTFWNDEPIRTAMTIAPGDSGIASFGAPTSAGGLSLSIRTCSPDKACATCPHSKIHWCGEGKHPSLLMQRRDGIAEGFVAMWSCFWLGEADAAFDGVVIFRKDGAFAYRDGSRSGWLVPGTSVASDFGDVKIS